MVVVLVEVVELVVGQRELHAALGHLLGLDDLAELALDPLLRDVGHRDAEGQRSGRCWGAQEGQIRPPTEGRKTHKTAT